MTKISTAKIGSKECFVKEYVKNYVLINERRQKTKYREPVIGFSSASDPLFKKLEEVVIPSHHLPQDILKNAKTVVSMFLPFSKEIIEGNYKGKRPTKDWAIAYTETNELLDRLCNDLADEFKAIGYDALGLKTTHHLTHARKEHYDYNELFSIWSQRHVAYISGIGKFGLNNLIITVRGCAGRIGSLLTSANIKPTKRDKKEYCLVKRGEYCYKCIENCPVDVLTKDGRFDRVGCMDYLIVQRKYQENVYGLKEGTQTCGKCSVNVPCESKIPD